MISFGRAPCDEGVIRAAAETPGCADSAKPWVLPYKYEAGTPLLRSDPWMVSQARPHPWRDLGIGRLNHGMYRCASISMDAVSAVRYFLCEIRCKRGVDWEYLQ
jgi:hypothetical protein